jgi:DNA-binding NarL/FixJ family response regulator
MHAESRQPPRAHSTCIVIDDHELMLSSLALLLAGEGLTVVGEARTGSEAIRLLEEHQPDLAVLDFRLPDMSGIDVAKTARGLSTAFVLHTAEADAVVAEAALVAGVLCIVAKGSPPHRLLAAIACALAGEPYLDPSFDLSPHGSSA